VSHGEYASDIVAVTDTMLKTWPIGQTADVSRLARDLIQNVAVRCIFGIDMTHGDQGLGDLATEVVDLLTSPVTVAMPFHIPGTPYPKLLARCERLAGRMEAIIDEKRRQPPGRRDALSIMIRAHDEDHASFTDDELVGEVNLLYFAGHDTQAKTLGWTLFLLAQHPEVLADVVDEIESVLRGGPPTVEHVPRMVLLDRVSYGLPMLVAPQDRHFVRREGVRGDIHEILELS
jgi:cytochrome P450